METTDKELIRQGRHFEALGENFNHKPVYVMLFDNRRFVDQLDERFSTQEEAIEWLKKNKKPLKGNEEWYFGNINSDWL